MDFATNPSSGPDRVSAAQLRVGDAERHDASAQLQAHFAAGRLTWEELDERLGQAWAARTQGELSVLFADLPAQQQTRSVQQQAAVARAAPAARRMPHFHPIYAIVFAVVAITGFVPEVWILFALVWVFLLGGGRRRHFGSHHGRTYQQRRATPFGR